MNTYEQDKAEIYLKYYPIIRMIVGAYLRVYNKSFKYKDYVDDIVHDVFYKFYKRYDEILQDERNQKYKLKTLFDVMVRNHIIDILRRKGSHQQFYVSNNYLERLEEETCQIESNIYTDGIDSKLDSDVIYPILHDAINALDKEKQYDRIITEYYFNHNSVEVSAKLLDKNLGTFKGQWNRALKQLRKELEKHPAILELLEYDATGNN